MLCLHGSGVMEVKRRRFCKAFHSLFSSRGHETIETSDGDVSPLEEHCQETETRIIPDGGEAVNNISISLVSTNPEQVPDSDCSRLNKSVLMRPTPSPSPSPLVKSSLSETEDLILSLAFDTTMSTTSTVLNEARSPRVITNSADVGLLPQQASTTGDINDISNISMMSRVSYSADTTGSYGTYDLPQSSEQSSSRLTSHHSKEGTYSMLQHNSDVVMLEEIHESMSDDDTCADWGTYPADSCVYEVHGVPYQKPYFYRNNSQHPGRHPGVMLHSEREYLARSLSYVSSAPLYPPISSDPLSEIVTNREPSSPPTLSSEPSGQAGRQPGEQPSIVVVSPQSEPFRCTDGSAPYTCEVSYHTASDATYMEPLKYDLSSFLFLNKAEFLHWKSIHSVVNDTLTKDGTGCGYACPLERSAIVNTTGRTTVPHKYGDTTVPAEDTPHPNPYLDTYLRISRKKHSVV